MNRLFSKSWLWGWLLVWIILPSCTDLVELEEHQPLEFTVNSTLPHRPSELKILAIGNSFTADGTIALPSLLYQTGLNNVTVATLTYGGCSLQEHYTFYTRNKAAYAFTLFNAQEMKTVSNSYTLRQALLYTDWDIIVLQQASAYSGQYASYQPYLNALLNLINRETADLNPVFAWQQTWAYASNSSNDGFKNYKRDQKKMYEQIVRTTGKMSIETGIELIIPSGTAIQNLRKTELNNPPKDLTDDGTHIDKGVGRYSLACAWFLTLIQPVFDVDLPGNVMEGTEGDVKVTNENFKTCQQAARDAYLEWAPIRPKTESK